MKVLVTLILLVLISPIVAVIIYAKIQLKKKIYLAEEIKVSNEVKDNIERCFNSVNGWIYLTVFSLSLHYIFNIWAVCFSLLTFFVVSFSGEEEYFSVAISICAIMSLFSTSLNLIIRPKDLFYQVNAAWEEAWFASTKFKLDIVGADEDTVKERLRKLQKTIVSLAQNVKFI